MYVNTEVVLAKIEELQNVQRRNHPSTEVWKEASKRLAVLFNEMSKRTTTGE